MLQMALIPGDPAQVFQRSHCFNHRAEEVHAYISTETLVWAKTEAQVIRNWPIKFHRPPAEALSALVSRSGSVEGAKLTVPGMLWDLDLRAARGFTAVNLFHVF